MLKLIHVRKYIFFGNYFFGAGRYMYNPYIFFPVYNFCYLGVLTSGKNVNFIGSFA